MTATIRAMNDATAVVSGIIGLDRHGVPDRGQVEQAVQDAIDGLRTAHPGDAIGAFVAVIRDLLDRLARDTGEPADEIWNDVATNLNMLVMRGDDHGLH